MICLMEHGFSLNSAPLIPSRRRSSLRLHLFVLLDANIFSGDIPVVGSTGLVLGKQRPPGGLPHLLHFPGGETEELIETEAVKRCLFHLQPLHTCCLGTLEFGDSAPAAFLSQSWPTEVYMLDVAPHLGLESETSTPNFR